MQKESSLPSFRYRLLLRSCAQKAVRTYPQRSMSRYIDAVFVLQETLKSVIAQYNASQLLTMREVRGCILAWHLALLSSASPCRVMIICAQVVSRDIRRILTQRAQYFNIYLDDVSITNLTFSREYTGAVEAKQVAQQEAERARFIVRTAVACTHLCHVTQPDMQVQIVGMADKSLRPQLLACKQ